MPCSAFTAARNVYNILGINNNPMWNTIHKKIHQNDIAGAKYHLAYFIKKKNKAILDLLGHRQEELKNMVETNKLKLTNDEEIIKVLAYYDSLTKG